jgi:hypothetical protein
MDGCRVVFEAQPSQIILEIDGCPQNSAEGTGKPFKMEFRKSRTSVLPAIILNGATLENITWYNEKRRYQDFLIPVIPENCEKANSQQGWAVFKTERAMWSQFAYVELNSAFLLP